MRGAIEFEYDVARDVVIATPHWRIETEDDVRAWYAQYEAYFEPLGRRVDVVFVLDHFDLRPRSACSGASTGRGCSSAIRATRSACIRASA